MVRPTQSQASAFADKLDRTGKVTRSAAQGGPSYRKTAAVKDLISHTSGVGMAVGADTAQLDYDNNHPTYASYNSPDDVDEDTRILFKAWLANQQRNTATDIYLGESKLEERDIKYFQNKLDQQELARFKHFCEASVERGTPWAKQFFEKIMPGWYDEKMQIIDEKLGYVRRYIDIVINGINSTEDMELMYMLYQGKIKLPATFAELIKDPAQGITGADYTSGIFSPKRYTAQNIRLSKNNQKLMSNFKIAGFNSTGAMVATAGDVYLETDDAALADVASSSFPTPIKLPNTKNLVGDKFGVSPAAGTDGLRLSRI